MFHIQSEKVHLVLGVNLVIVMVALANTDNNMWHLCSLGYRLYRYCIQMLYWHIETLN